MKFLFVLFLSAFALGVCDARAAELAAVEDFGPNPGDLDMYEYVPDGMADGAPLVVLLHGCGQEASDFDDETGWTAEADASKFALVLAQQRRTNNLFACFNWFEPLDRDRDEGEARSIRSMVEYALKNRAVDTGRVFVAGLSAGGGMAAALLAVYPEVFAGGAVMAGVHYGCADGMVSGMRCMLNPAEEEDAKALGDHVRALGHDDRWPRVMIWHGLADKVVHPLNAVALASQWADLHQIPPERTKTRKGEGFVHTVHMGEGGRALIEAYAIDGIGHGVPVDPGAGCGKAGDFILEAGLCAARLTAEFWGIQRLRNGSNAIK